MIYIHIGLDKTDYCVCGEGLTQFPKNIPENTERFFLTGNEIKEHNPKSYLPEGLKVLHLDGNLLKKIPNNIPNNLLELILDYNLITEIPNTLPSGLKILSLVGNLITEFPEKLPPGLQSLDLGDNKIETIPEDLPNSLRVLAVMLNEIKTIPKNLPENLEELWIDRNSIKFIEDLTLPSLSVLVISENTEIKNCFFSLKKPNLKNITLETMSHRFSKRDLEKGLGQKVDSIKAVFELWSLREEGARFWRAQREYEDIFL